MKRLMLSIIILAMFLSGCGKTEKTSGISIVTTVFPPYDFACAIAGDKAEVKMLLKPGGEVHSYEPSPTDIMDINRCDLFIYTGGENDSWAESVLESAENTDTLKMVDCVELIGETHNHNDGKHIEPDEHVWTYPENAIKICEAICEKLCKMDTDNQSIYNENTEKLISELRSLDEEIKQVISSSKRKELVFADRFAVRYFTEGYGLEAISAFPGCSGETEANPKTVAEIINKVKCESIPVVLYAELSNTDMADTVCKATGVQKRLFHSCHNLSKEDFDSGKTYIDITKNNIEVLKEALN